MNLKGSDRKQIQSYHVMELFFPRSYEFKHYTFSVN